MEIKNSLPCIYQPELKYQDFSINHRRKWTIINVGGLYMYCHFCTFQSTVGPCNVPKPGALDFVGKAKWNAWKELGEISNVS